MMAKRPEPMVMRWVLALIWAWTAVSTALAAPRVGSAGDVGFTCEGAFTQGGLVVCAARDALLVRDTVLAPNAAGRIHIGIPRDAPTHLVVARADNPTRRATYVIAPREFPETRLEGLPPAKVTPRTPEQQAAVARSWEVKRAAFETVIAGDDFADGFVQPAQGRISGVYGSRRVLVVDGRDDPNIRTHWGLDIAAPTGAPVIAPAAGVVTLADPDLYFEGGTIFLDHGEGLVSVFMHLSALDVEPGERVAQGERIGAIGNTGRSTGPHLHWGLKWRDQFYVDPALALDLAPRG